MFSALCGKEQFEIKNIVIVGASRIGIKTASLLEKNYHVKIIEKDREKCIQLADKLKSTLVINGDGRDLTLLREEGIKNVDAFISLTGSSETNILSCLLAKKMGVKKSVAEVENIDYIDPGRKYRNRYVNQYQTDCSLPYLPLHHECRCPPSEIFNFFRSRSIRTGSSAWV